MSRTLRTNPERRDTYRWHAQQLDKAMAEGDQWGIVYHARHVIGKQTDAYLNRDGVRNRQSKRGCPSTRYRRRSHH